MRLTSCSMEKREYEGFGKRTKGESLTRNGMPDAKRRQALSGPSTWINKPRHYGIAHTRTLVSPLPDWKNPLPVASMAPSGDQATDQTGASCPRIHASRAPLSTSQSESARSLPVVARMSPDGE
jgi:hypothetical protein